jgi:uncharacterized membrane protein HdeD (DUF308 family)
MNSNTNREIMGIVTIIVGIVFIIYPPIFSYLIGILLVVFGIVELINREMD